MQDFDNLSFLSFIEDQSGDTVQCVHCWNKVTREAIAEEDSSCPRCGRYLDMDEEPYA